MAKTDEIKTLHKRCGIYTKPELVRRILDSVNWTEKFDLAGSQLLEPAAGDGAFLVEAARRLVESLRQRGRALRASTLRGRIKAFELHRREARRARARLMSTLKDLGVSSRTAQSCIRAWVVNGDFLLAQIPPGTFTHAVGNPPYVRWSKIPRTLKAQYRRRLPRAMTGGDLFLPFLDRALESLRENGRCGFVCSDRWRFMAFAENFREKWLPRLRIENENRVDVADAFVENVDSYPTILVASKLSPATRRRRVSRGTGVPLGEIGCVVKVGPALGHTPAYVLLPDEKDVEAHLLHPWIDSSEIAEGLVSWTGRRVINMHDANGKLLDPAEHPFLGRRLERFREKLETRSIVRNGKPWYRPIDRVRAKDWKRPKLLVPELAKVARVAVDRSGAIPSHGVYAIFAPDDDVDSLYEKLARGRLDEALRKIAPRVKGGYVRCYKRFLLMMRVD